MKLLGSAKSNATLVIYATLTVGIALGGSQEALADTHNAWMASTIVAQQNIAKSGEKKEAVANHRAKLLLSAMSLDQKMQQLAGGAPELLPELPNCYGGRHVNGVASLNIPTFRISNGPVGVGQNDCVSVSVRDAVSAKTAPWYAALSHSSSAHATALPSAIAVAASFDPSVASTFGGVIATEMNNLALHVFEAPGGNLARLPILGRNFEYFGEDPYLAGSMVVAETKAIQSKGLIAMVKHFVANEQETNRSTIEETIDRQVLRELYLLPFEMAVKDGDIAAVMCAYNYVNGASSCENREMLTDILRYDWGFTGYVQSDFYAMKSTVATLKAGLDHEMPIPLFWAKDKLEAALSSGELSIGDIDQALERRYTQMFKAGIFDRPLVQTPIDFAEGGRKAREIGTESAVLLQNNGALPLNPRLGTVALIGKASQVYAQQAVAGGAMTGMPMGAGGGSSDVVPNYTVSPIEGIRNALGASGNASANVRLILVDNQNKSATIDGHEVSFAAAMAAAAAADAVVMMAGTISEEGADRASFTSDRGTELAASAAEGHGLDWYTPKPTMIATPGVAKNSNTVAMIKAIMATPSTTSRRMAEKAVLVLKDNASVAMEPALVGNLGPAILEVWFPGQEDGNIVADLLFGRKNPSGKSPVTFPFIERGFLDNVSARQFPGVSVAKSKLILDQSYKPILAQDGNIQTVAYSEGLNIGYRWYDANVSGHCAIARNTNPCVAFPFGHGLSYSSFAMSGPKLFLNAKTGAFDVRATVTNTGKIAGAQTLQVYLSLPVSASEGNAAQPPKRLVGFRKIHLEPGTSGKIAIAIDPNASNHPLSIWNAKTHAWILPAGKYTVFMGTSSSPKDLVQAGTFVR